MVLIVGLLGMAANPHAAMSDSPWKEHEGWVEQVRGKRAYGAKNVLLGGTEFIAEPDEALRPCGGERMSGVAWRLACSMPSRTPWGAPRADLSDDRARHHPS